MSAPGDVRPGAGRARFRVLLLAVVFAVLQLANVTGRDSPDSKNYLSYALSLGGAGKHEAASLTIDYVCAGKASLARRAQSVDVLRFHAPSPARRVFEECRREQWQGVTQRLRAGQTSGHTVPFMSARFMRIFEARPGYPALLAPFVKVLGVTWGVWASSVLVTAAGGVLAFLVLRTLRAPAVAALAGQALFYVLPCGTTAMRPMTEGLLLDLTLAALWGCALALEGRGRAGTLLVGGSLAALFAVKHSQALFLGLCLAGACAVTGVRRGGLRRPLRGLTPPFAAIGAVAAGAVVVTVLAARALRYPSESESAQDLLTGHFTVPDRGRPWPELLHLEADFWVEWLRRGLWEPFVLAALAAGAWGVARRRPAFAVLLVAGALTGVLNQAAHPDITIYGDRLIVLVWVLPVVGLPLLLEPAVRHRARGLETVPGPLRTDAGVTP
ncbi:hypothetical protein EAO69_08150 [Streptomyces sp. me109]|uniref:hypothetical protein n=1 Tax=Streptomyces sp. me109 TaxID=1827853 RepID=UPI0011CDDDBB|nr:hypothetical protein [Streptomyces sp. me109]TXS76400.1 hypothetical protein EAO69_08150 [Streptomyces sp. me109]